MKTSKFMWLFVCSLLSLFTVNAQEGPSVTMHTTLEHGTSITLFPKTDSKETPIRIDFGDGEIVEKKIDPNSSGYFARFDGAVKGEYIKIYAPLISLEADELDIDQFSLNGQDKLIRLSLKKNLIDKENLDIMGAPNLEILDLSYNRMSSYDFRPYKNLKQLNLSHNPSVGNILLSEGIDIEAIDLSYCDVSVFYPISLPKLSSINLSHNALMNLEIADHYPNLSALNVEHNDLEELDVTKCYELAQLVCDSNRLTSIDVTFNAKLTQLNCAVNQIQHLNVSNNKILTSLSCGHNNISELDITNLAMLTQLSCENNKIDFLNLPSATFLKRLTANDNKLHFLDFDQNRGSLQFVDIRNNENTTAASINFMFQTLPEHNGRSYSSNFLIKGCTGAEHSDPSLINMNTGGDNDWILDINGDGHIADPSFDYNQKYPIIVKQSQFGTMTLTQSTNKYGQDYKPVQNEVYVGRVIKADVNPQVGYIFKGILINGQLFAHNIFVINEPNSTIEPLFEKPSIIKLRVDQEQELSFALSVPEGKEGVTIDWGDGVKVPYKVATTGLTRINQKAISETVIIEGAIKKAVFDSYPGMDAGIDNNLKGIEITSQKSLKSLELFMNQRIGSLDLTECPNLTTLNCEYCGLTSLNLDGLTKLDTLMCGGNSLKELNLEHLNNLVELNVKGNNLTRLNVTNSPKLVKLVVTNNSLSAIEGLDKLSKLKSLDVSFNSFEELDLSKNAELIGLSVQNNNLTTLDLSKNAELVTFNFNNNNIKALDLSNNQKLGYVSLAGNAMTACQLNDFYYTLPNHVDIEGFQLNFTLFTSDNQGNKNDADHAESKIAVLKGWKLNYEGDGSGCDEVYIDVVPVKNGSLTIKNATNSVVVPGTKVKKSTKLTFEAKADDGFHCAFLQANGKKIEMNEPYTIERYTIFRLAIQKGTAIENVEQNIFRVENGTLIVEQPSSNVVLYDMSGNTLFTSEVKDVVEISVKPGAYILKVTNGGNGTQVYKVIVK